MGFGCSPGPIRTMLLELCCLKRSFLLLQLLPRTTCCCCCFCCCCCCFFSGDSRRPGRGVEAHAVVEHLVDAAQEKAGHHDSGDLLATLGEHPLVRRPVARDLAKPRAGLDQKVSKMTIGSTSSYPPVMARPVRLPHPRRRSRILALAGTFAIARSRMAQSVAAMSLVWKSSALRPCSLASWTCRMTSGGQSPVHAGHSPCCCMEPRSVKPSFA